MKAQDFFNATVGYRKDWDSNLFRISNQNSFATQNYRKRSESIGIASAAIDLEQNYSLNKFALNATLVDYKYENFRYLSFTGLNYSGYWDWSLTPRFKGRLESSRIERPTSYRDYQGFNARNVYVNRATKLNGEYDLGGQLRVFIGADQISATEEQPVILEGDRSSKSYYAGIRYVESSGSEVAFRLRRGEGSTIGYSDNNLSSIASNDFRESSGEIEFRLRTTEKLSVGGRLGIMHRLINDSALSDYSEPYGELRSEWQLTQKTKVAAVAQRQVSAYQAINSSYITTNAVRLVGSWNTTAKTSIEMQLERGNRMYGGGDSDRTDDYKTVAIELNWAPVRSTSIYLRSRMYRNASSIFGANYRYDVISVGATLKF